MTEVFNKLGHLVMGSQAAFGVFFVVIIMLAISTYLDLESKLLFGHVSSSLCFFPFPLLSRLTLQRAVLGPLHRITHP